MQIWITILATAMLFVVMVLLLALKSRAASRVSGILITLVACGGLLIYGYGFSQTLTDLPLAVVRSLLAVLGMFLGKNEFSAIAAAPLLKYEWMQIVFWLLHLMAIYVIAAAALVAVGSEALKKLRLWLARRGKLDLIFGIHADSVQLGKQLLARRGHVVVFVDEKADAAQVSAITVSGGAVRSDPHALAAGKKFLRSMGMKTGKRQLTLYAMDKDTSRNVAYARKMLTGLQQQGISPEQTRLVILTQEDGAIRQLQVSENRYGYGDVSAVLEPELAARLLVRSYPPCNYVNFDGIGRATDNFEALIIGFGQTGREVLRQLVMNGQFEGSTFHAAVFAPDCCQVDGFFASQYSALPENYDISLHPYDGRSRQLYDHLLERADRIRYVAICTGSDKMNHELAEDILDYFRLHNRQIPVYSCSHSGVKAYAMDGVVAEHQKLYTAELLSRSELDRMAMILNHRYHSGTGRTICENWLACDYFSRQSCRAAADFATAMLRIAGKTKQEALECWQLPEKLLLNMSKTEHLRWNAFHFAMGYRTMSQEEFDRRAARYLQQKQAGEATIRISKNTAERTHACLVSWEELERLSEKEQAVTGIYTDYQAMDSENVLAVQQLLQALQDGEVAQ